MAGVAVPLGESHGSLSWLRLVDRIFERDLFRCRYEQGGRRCVNDALFVTHVERDPARRRDPDNLVSCCGRHYGGDFRDRTRAPAQGRNALSQQRRRSRARRRIYESHETLRKRAAERRSKLSPVPDE